MVKIAKTEIMLGCDPEVFIINKETGEAVPGVGLIPGTKEEPFLVENGMVQVDGLALEFGINPSKTKKQFVSNIKSVVKQLASMLPNHLSLNFVPAVTFSEEALAGLPPQALELGCDPDFNCYTLKANKKPTPPSEGFRSAGGHVHIGWGTYFDPFSSEHRDTCAMLVAELDAKLGVPSLAWDADASRRKLYGAAGSFRPKPYGLEYRSLSNQWLLSEDLIGFVWDQTVEAVRACFESNRTSLVETSFFNKRVTLTARKIIDGGWDSIGKFAYKEVLVNNV